MRLVEIVFEAEIKTFGLEFEEVVEIVKESIGEGDRFDITLDDWEQIKQREDEEARLFCKFAVSLAAGFKYIGNSPGEFLRKAIEELKEVLDDIGRKLEYYSMIKPFLNIYSRNGRNGIRNVFEEKGIEVIS